MSAQSTIDDALQCVTKVTSQMSLDVTHPELRSTETLSAANSAGTTLPDGVLNTTAGFLRHDFATTESCLLPEHKILAGRDPFVGRDLVLQPALSCYEIARTPCALYRMGMEVAHCRVERHKARRITIDLSSADDVAHDTQRQTCRVS